MQVDVYLYECLLQQIVRILGRGGALQEQPPNGVAVAVEQILERRVIAVEREFHQPTVVGDYVVGYLHTLLSLRSSAIRTHNMSSGFSRSNMKYRSTTPFSPARSAIDLMRAATTA